MMQAQKRIEVLPPIEHCLDVWLWRDPGIPNDVLEVRRSPMVETTDDWYAPVIDFLASKCSREISWETVEDPGYFYGEYYRTEYVIYEMCPGGTIDHNCARMRRNEHWLTTGQ